MDFKNKKDFVKYLGTVDISTLPRAQQDMLTKFLEEEAIASARVNFFSFIKLLGPKIIDGFVVGRHIEKIAEELDDLAARMWLKEGLTVRKMLSMAPGGSKSQICSRLFPAYILGRWPKARVILVGYGLLFARDEYGSKVRDIMRTEEYQKIFPGTDLRADKQTEGRFLTTKGGEVVCGSLHAKIAGRRGHIIICDDALVEDDAKSKSIRMELTEKYIPNVRSRLLMTPAGAELICGTRWCVGDLFDYMEQQDKHSPSPWKVIKIPALLDEESSEYLRKPGDPDDYLVPGTSFWPEFQRTEKLLMLRASYVNKMSQWNATYMQNPVPDEGQLLSPGDFRQWKSDKPPKCHTLVLTADTAFTKGTQSDYTAIQLWGIFNMNDTHENGMSKFRPNCILLDSRKGKWDFTELCNIFAEIYYRKKPDYILIEYRASGLAIVPELRKRGFPVVEYKTSKDKIERMQASAPLVKSGIFWVPMPQERQDVCQKAMDFVNEIVIFPAGNHDDVADAFSQLVLWLRDSNLLIGDGYADQDFSGMEEENFALQNPVSYTSALLRK